jgi:hypothetical protein
MRILLSAAWAQESTNKPGILELFVCLRGDNVDSGTCWSIKDDISTLPEKDPILSATRNGLPGKLPLI